MAYQLAKFTRSDTTITDTPHNKDSSMIEVSYFGSKSIQTFNKKLKELPESTFTTEESFNGENIFVNIKAQEQKQAVSHSLSTEEWEGCITKVNEDSFNARLCQLYPKTNKIIDGEFDFSEVSEDQRDLIEEGVIFYWSIGKEVKKSSTVSNPDYITFRRMPSWRKFDIDSSSSIADEFVKAFNKNDC